MVLFYEVLLRGQVGVVACWSTISESYELTRIKLNDYLIWAISVSNCIIATFYGESFFSGVSSAILYRDDPPFWEVLRLSDYLSSWFWVCNLEISWAWDALVDSSSDTSHISWFTFLVKDLSLRCLKTNSKSDNADEKVFLGSVCGRSWGVSLKVF